MGLPGAATAPLAMVVVSVVTMRVATPRTKNDDGIRRMNHSLPKTAQRGNTSEAIGERGVNQFLAQASVSSRAEM